MVIACGSFFGPFVIFNVHKYIPYFEIDKTTKQWKPYFMFSHSPISYERKRQVSQLDFYEYD